MTETIEWTPKARAVLEAASELFYERGIHAVGVDTIVEHAGVTKKTLYDRFGSKERLVVAYLSERDTRWRAFLTDRLSLADPEPAARIAAVFDASAAWSREHGHKGCAMVNAHAEISDPAHPAYAVIVEQKRWMLELLTEVVRVSGADDPNEVAGQVLLLHEGAVVASALHAVPDPFDSAARAAARLVEAPPRSERRQRPHRASSR